ncbi:MAG: hypothetical protein ACK4NV_04940 [Pannonibacter sp.]
MPQGNASFCQAMQSGTAAGAAFPADLAKPLRLSTLSFVMPWLDHGIHAVAFPSGTD